ncbi:MAG: glycosyltransferase [Acidobacteria bacterium]|nr:glycosyltransferase [Acidobacteriota bacterium]
MSHVSRPRVLLIAELCNPRWVSVPLEGWSHSQALRGVADVHLVTRRLNRESILAEGLREGVDFTAVEPGLVKRFSRWLATVLRGGQSVGWTTAAALASLTYYGFERRLWCRLGPKVEAGEFDIVHRLTPVSPSAVSPVARWCRRAGVPFVLGPLNGGLPMPRGFEDVLRGEREWLAPLRKAQVLLPGYRATREHASAILAGSRVAFAEVSERHGPRLVYIPENGVDASRFHRHVEGPVRRPVRVAFAGRHVRLKGIDMLLEAAAPLVRGASLHLDILGRGPETPRLEAMVQEKGLQSGVDLPGWVDHDQLQDRLIRSDVFAFPSVRDFGGGAVVEAMALGLMPIVLDYGGPGELVSPEAGFALPMGSRPEVVERLRSALSRLVDDPSVIRPMGDRARQRALGLFTWEAKAAQVQAVYRWVLGEEAAKPDFGMPLKDRATDPERSP